MPYDVGHMKDEELASFQTELTEDKAKAGLRTDLYGETMSAYIAQVNDALDSIAREQHRRKLLAELGWEVFRVS